MEFLPLKQGVTGAEEFSAGDTLPISVGGVPTGGATDQVLTKVSDTDLDVDWSFIRRMDFNVEPVVDQSGQGFFTTSLLTGVAVSAFEVLYLGPSSTWLKANATSASTGKGMIAMAMESKGSGVLIRVAFPGSVIRNDAWSWTAGEPLFLLDTAGTMSHTPPSGTDKVVRVMGFALTDDCIYFNPSPDYITLT